MLRAVAYIDNQGEAILYRCYGEGGYPEIPDYVDGLPVTSLADHCFAPEPSFRLRNRPRKLAVQQPDGSFRSDKTGRSGPPGSGAATDHTGFGASMPKNGSEETSLPAIAGLALREVYLPQQVRSIGDYTFYGCRNLQRLHVPASLEHVGGGCFVDVHQLKEIFFSIPYEPGCAYGHGSDRGSGDKSGPEPAGASTSGPFPKSLKAVVVDIPDEVEAVVQAEDGRELYRLVFPGYYEESLENTPARIIQVVYQGMGFKYRQCLKDGAVDMNRYDGLFYETSVQEYPDTVMRLTFDRLALAAHAPAAAGAESIIAGSAPAAAHLAVRQAAPERTHNKNQDFLFLLRPSPAAQERYLNYLRDQADRICRHVVAGQQIDRLRLLCDLPYFDEQRLAHFMGEAGKAGWAQAVSLLMEYQRTHFAPEKKTKKHKYEL